MRFIPRKRISELESLYSASVNTFVVGVDNGTTYKIETSAFAEAVISSVSASIDSRLDYLETLSGSYNDFSNSYHTDSASFDGRIIAATNEQDLSYLVTTSSFNSFTQSQNQLNTTWATTGSNTFIGNQYVSGTIWMSGSIIPIADESLTSSFSLGSSTNAWKDIWVSQGTIHFIGSDGAVKDTLSATADGLAMSNLLVTGSIIATSITGSLLSTNGVISGSQQIVDLGFATTGSNTFYGNQTIHGTVAVNVMMNPQNITEYVLIPTGFNALILGEVGFQNEVVVETGALLTIL